MKAQKEKQFILTGSLWRVMWQLSWPAIIAMVLYGLNAVLDGVFVGYYVGATALAGVSLAFPLTQISVALGSLIGVGAGSILSIAIGSQDKESQRKILPNVNYLTIVVTIVYMIIALLCSKQLLQMMGGSGEALQIGEEYFRITIFGSLFWTYGLAANMIIRAEGRMKTAAWMMGLGLVINVGSNFVLMGMLDLGVKGAAWGTNLAMLVYTLLGLWYFASGRASFQAQIWRIKRETKVIKQLLSLGLGSFIMTIMNLVQALLVFNALARYGTVWDIAFYGVVFRIFTFLLTPIFGLMRALQPVIGINFGAQQYERVKKSYMVFSITALVLTLPFWITSMISPQSILQFMLVDATFTAIDLSYFRVYMALLPLLAIIFMAMTFFPAIEKGKPAAIIGITRQLIFYVPAMLILPYYFGVAGIYYSAFIIDAIILVWTVLLVRKEFIQLH